MKVAPTEGGTRLPEPSNNNDSNKQMLAAEYLVELHSADLKKELRLGDLVL